MSRCVCALVLERPSVCLLLDVPRAVGVRGGIVDEGLVESGSVAWAYLFWMTFHGPVESEAELPSGDNASLHHGDRGLQGCR